MLVMSATDLKGRKGLTTRLLHHIWTLALKAKGTATNGGSHQVEVNLIMSNSGGGGDRGEYVVQGAQQGLQQLKYETAAELGIQNYQGSYKGDLPSRVNGSVGGYMVKKMIALAEASLSGGAGGGTI
jgi:hypothetical protein